jgi:polar amino acid transport system substrate-binding protein
MGSIAISSIPPPEMRLVMKRLIKIVVPIQIGLLIFCWFCFVPSSQAEEAVPPKLVAVINDQPTPELILFKELVYEICNRLKIDLQLVVLPHARAAHEVNLGTYDADGPRNPTVEKNHPNLVRVPEVFFFNDLVAFAKDAVIKLSGWDSLKPLRVAYVRGWQVYETNVKGVKNLEILDSENALFKFLDAGRTDVALAARYLGLRIIRDLDLKGIYIVEPPLVIKKMYLYLNQKHEKLALIFAKTLRTMKTDGTYQKIYDKIMGPIL